MKRSPATADKEKGNPPRPFSADAASGRCARCPHTALRSQCVLL